MHLAFGRWMNCTLVASTFEADADGKWYFCKSTHLTYLELWMRACCVVDERHGEAAVRLMLLVERIDNLACSLNKNNLTRSL